MNLRWWNLLNIFIRDTIFLEITIFSIFIIVLIVDSLIFEAIPWQLVSWMAAFNLSDD